MQPDVGLAAAVHWGGLGRLLVVAVAIMASPGPATISLVAVGSARGMRVSLPYLAGVIGGTTVVLLAVASGVTAAVLAVPAAASALTALSALYLLWLAYHIATAPALAATVPSSRAPSLAAGAFLGVSNPKAWVGIAAVFASARLSDAATADALAKTLVLTAMVVAVNVTWLGIGASLAPLLRNARRARVVNVSLAVALVGAAALAVVH